MTQPNVSYKAQDANYLGTLRSKLGDLQGIETLTYELIQNADDVKTETGELGASSMLFDVCDDALIVENDGVFRDVDFGRMTEILHGGKAQEADTTGAFGIGFVSVYQVTDTPQIISSGQQWTIRPSAERDQRIEILEPIETQGTRFRLPWSTDPTSETRKALLAPPLAAEQIKSFPERIAEAVRHAALFLRQLERLEVRHNGRQLVCIERSIDGNELLLADGSKIVSWHFLQRDYDEAAKWLSEKKLRGLELNRRATVTIAIASDSTEEITSGRLYATLPSDTPTPIPVCINADFFPTTDRKHIRFEDDWRGEWNGLALHAAAVTIRDAVPQLSRLLGAERWGHLLDRIYDQKDEHPWGIFWRKIHETVKCHRTVQIEQGDWCLPSDTMLTSSSPERAATELLASLGIPVVSREMRPAFTVLRSREIGVPLLNLEHIWRSEKLQAGVAWDEAITSREEWQKLWKAISSIVAYRQQRQSQMLIKLPVAWDEAGQLQPLEQLWCGDEATRQLFPDAAWVSAELEDVPLLAKAIPEFDVSAALDLLEQQDLSQRWRAGEVSLPTLFGWFADRVSDVRQYYISRRFLALNLVPIGDELVPLDGLYLSAGFEDPLDSAEIIPLGEIGGENITSFLNQLGISKLTFENWLTQRLGNAFRVANSLSVENLWATIRLLAQRLGEFRSNYQIENTLRTLPLVACTDGYFRPAQSVYFNEPVVRAVLPDQAYLAETPDEAIEAFYLWLGVATAPRLSDIVNRIGVLTSTAPTDESVELIADIFDYLAEIFDDIKTDHRLALLKQQYWLPIHGDLSRWYRPNETDAEFNRSLFETQGKFLKIPLSAQRKGNQFLSFLTVKTYPSVAQVVRHLRVSSVQGLVIRRDVYIFLNNNHDAQEVGWLSDEACVLLADGRYVEPKKLFWQSHPFGVYRYQMGSDWRQYQPLFDRWGMKESATWEDAIAVLHEIAEEAGNSGLSDELLTIVMACWRLLDEALGAGRISAETLSAYKEQKLIPDPRGMMTQPVNLFFEDQPGLQNRFPILLRYNVLLRSNDTWRSMHAAGVRWLSEIVKPEFTDGVDSEDVTGPMANLFSQRWRSLERVLISEDATSEEAVSPERLLTLTYRQADVLPVRFRLTGFGTNRLTDEIAVRALYLSDDDMLYLTTKRSWTAIARELSRALRPGTEVGGLANGIHTILSAETPEEAKQALNELGYPRSADAIEEADVSSQEASLGGDVADPEESDTDFGSDDFAGGDSAEGSTGGGTSSGQATGSPTGQSTDGSSGGGAGHSSGGTGGRGDSAEGGGSGQGRRPTKRSKTRRLMSYVLPEKERTEEEVERSRQQQQNNLTTDAAGIEHVLNYETEQGRIPEEQAHNNAGFDVKSMDADGEVQRYIEVKSLKGEWERNNPAKLTPTQFKRGQYEKSRYWIYIVEYATSETPTIYCINNPIERIDRFLFDSGWKDIVDEQG